MHAIERNLIHMKRALIIGGGPAGLTAAYELLKGSKAKNPPEEIEVIVLEESGLLGGISKTVNYNGNRMDMGGHRFFSKDPKVNAWWKEMLPPQGAPAYAVSYTHLDVYKRQATTAQSHPQSRTHCRSRSRISWKKYRSFPQWPPDSSS